MPLNEYGDAVNDDFVPESPVLRGETQVPDRADDPHRQYQLDELPHRERVTRGVAGDEPDPGYDPDADDLDVIP